MNRILYLSILLFSFTICAGQPDGLEDDLTWNVRRELLKIPMRDGILLEAICYRPDSNGSFPAIVYRTPYGKDDYDSYAQFPLKAAKNGFAVFLVDVRGRYGSEGNFRAYHQERPDGVDVIDWIASQPYVNGRVGSYGGSYPGIVQWLALAEAPDALKAAAPDMTPINSHYFFYFGGAFSLPWLDWFMPLIVPDLRKRANDSSGPQTEAEAYEPWARERDKWYAYRPLAENPLLKEYAPYYYDWLSHPDKSDWWKFASVEDDFDKIKAPVLLLSGWYDAAYGPLGAIQAYEKTAAGAATVVAREHSRLIIGPWNHTSVDVTKQHFGEVNFGHDAGLDFSGILLDWFTLHLKERQAPALPPVSLFLMGANKWRHYPGWPIPGVSDTSLYLQNGTDPKSGILTFERPDQRTSQWYTFDPKDPVYDKSFEKSYPYDQKDIISRPDVLVYTSDVLEHDMEVTGIVEAMLEVTSSASDTDFHVILCDVYPDGTSINLTGLDAGYLRMRYREGLDRQVLMEPGASYEVSINNAVTSNLFKKGHQIRLYVTSSSFPHYDPNPNTGSEIAKEDTLVEAVNTVFTGGKSPSRLVLPVVLKQ